MTPVPEEFEASLQGSYMGRVSKLGSFLGVLLFEG